MASVATPTNDNDEKEEEKLHCLNSTLDFMVDLREFVANGFSAKRCAKPVL